MFWAANFELPVRGTGAGHRPDAAAAAVGRPFDAAENAAHPRAQPQLLRTVSVARGPVFVFAAGARSLPGAEPRNLRGAGLFPEESRDRNCRANRQTRRANPDGTAQLRVAAGTLVLVRIEREEFRVLVRTPEQRSFPDRHTDLREPDSA